MITNIDANKYFSLLTPRFVIEASFNALLDVCVAQQPIPELVTEAKIILDKDLQFICDSRITELENEAFFQQIQLDEKQCAEDTLQQEQDEKLESTIEAFFNKYLSRIPFLTQQITATNTTLIELDQRTTVLTQEVEQKKNVQTANPLSEQNSADIGDHILIALQNELNAISKRTNSLNEQKKKYQEEIESIERNTQTNNIKLSELTIRKIKYLEQEEGRTRRKKAREINSKDLNQLSKDLHQKLLKDIDIIKEELAEIKININNQIDKEAYGYFLEYIVKNFQDLPLLDSQKQIISNTIKLTAKFQVIKYNLDEKRQLLCNLSAILEKKKIDLLKLEELYGNKEDRLELLLKQNIELDNENKALIDKIRILNEKADDWGTASAGLLATSILCFMLAVASGFTPAATIAETLSNLSFWMFQSVVTAFSGIVSLVVALTYSFMNNAMENNLSQKQETFKKNEMETKAIVETSNLKQDIEVLNRRHDETRKIKQELEDEYKCILFNIQNLNDQKAPKQSFRFFQNSTLSLPANVNHASDNVKGASM